MEPPHNETLSRIERIRNRTLDDPKKVFEKNAWDDVRWDDMQMKLAEDKVLLNSSAPMSDDASRDYLQNAASYWNDFYKMHTDQFFKDRKWLDSEFPELKDADDSVDETAKNGEKSRSVVFETGCGVGNTVIPLLCATRNTFVYCCDFSEEAICLLKHRPEYSSDRCYAFVGDLTEEDPHKWPMKSESVDFIVMLFTLSAIRPDKVPSVIKLVVSFLRPGGQILFRDYGKYDLAQLRFKQKQCVGENVYVRQDGTLARFFTQDEIRKLFAAEGMREEQNAVDRRLLVNRKRNLLMHRVWIQCSETHQLCLKGGTNAIRRVLERTN